MWLVYAVLAALCAALVGIFGKWGMREVNPDLATGVRGVVQALVLVIIVASLGHFRQLRTIHTKAQIAIVLSGLAGGLSWLFGFRAINLVGVAKVAPIDKLSVPIAVLLAVLLFHENVKPINWVGVACITIGAYLTAIK